ncbi:hypothetical protein [Dankookia sp. P2]|uniref:hypothetical protein n=1 Tax=Dankookia sp. P2 TaxID=3423955 RepID=UPI003D6794B8
MVERLEMRDDQRAAGARRGLGEALGQRRQDGAVGDRPLGRQAKHPRRDRPAHAPVLDLLVAPGRRQVVADAAGEDVQPLQRAAGHADDGADADEAGLGILVEQRRRQTPPERGVQVVAEIRYLLAVVDELHGTAFCDQQETGGAAGARLGRLSAALEA